MTARRLCRIALSKSEARSYVDYVDDCLATGGAMEAGAASLSTPGEINESLRQDVAARPQTRAQSITEIAGLIALISGLIVLGLVAIAAMIVAPGGSKEVAVGAFGVIGSVVGAYFGLKVGAESAQKSADGQRQEAAKAQVFAAHITDADPDAVLKQAREAARAASVVKR